MLGDSIALDDHHISEVGDGDIVRPADRLGAERPVALGGRISPSGVIGTGRSFAADSIRTCILAAPGLGSRDRAAAGEEIGKEEDRVVELDLAGVIRIGGIEATELRPAKEEVAEGGHSIADIDV